jgi:hypothetical protein
MSTRINTSDTLRAFRAANLFYPAILILSFALTASAQGVGSSRGLSSGEGKHTIQGRVYLPAGQTPNGRSVKVILESHSTTAGGASTVTDQDGIFRFNNLPPGNYSVVIESGKEYDAVRESVTIDPIGAGGRIVQVSLQLRPKVDASNPVFAGVPKAALDLYQKGTTAAQKGNAKGAVEFLSQAVAASPTFSLALNELGMQYLRLAQMDKAAETFEALVKLKPGDALAQLNLGIALYNMSGTLLGEKKVEESQQKLSGAEEHLRVAINLKSPGPSAHYYLGLALIRFKRYDEAQKELELAIGNGGENLPLAHRFLGGLYQSAHRNKEAADELEKYLQLDPKAKDADTIKGIIEKLRKP